MFSRMYSVCEPKRVRRDFVLCFRFVASLFSFGERKRLQFCSNGSVCCVPLIPHISAQHPPPVLLFGTPSCGSRDCCEGRTLTAVSA